MSIFPPSISKSNKRNLGRAFLVLGLLAAAGTSLPAGGSKLPPFLEEFKRNDQPATMSQPVSFLSALGTVNGFLARPDTKEQLPAVLLVHDKSGLTEWMKQNARELSSIGYVVLAVDLMEDVRAAQSERQTFREDERVLAKLSAALRWLRRRPDVAPDRIGVVGWSWGAGQALALAASERVQACVLCHGPVSDAPGVLAALRVTPLLCILAGDDSTHAKATAVFRRALAKEHIPHKIAVFDGVSPGFMGPPGSKAYVEKAAEDAWVEMYEFLGKHVEDASPPLQPSSSRKVAAIADIMRAANNPTGVRGVLIGSLAKKPSSEAGWRQVHAEAALLAEAAGLLEGLKPPRGSHQSWQEQVHAFREIAQGIVSAAERHDLAAANDGVERFGKRCAACHMRHR